MTVVVDTNVLIDYLRAHQPARGLIRGAAAEQQRLLASTMTKVEVLGGMRSDERDATRQLLAVLEWVPVSDAIAERAGALARSFRASHQSIEAVDYAIAATAQELDAELWTCNAKHFPMFPDLAAPY